MGSMCKEKAHLEVGVKKGDSTMNYEEILYGVDAKTINDVVVNICTAVRGKGLSFRQAEALMDITKEKLKDAKI